MPCMHGKQTNAWMGKCMRRGCMRSCGAVGGSVLGEGESRESESERKGGVWRLAPGFWRADGAHLSSFREM